MPNQKRKKAPDVIVSTNIVEKTLGKDISTSLSRYDPFKGGGVSINDIISIEETGQAISLYEDKQGEKPSLSDIIVRQALEKLPDLEKKVLVWHYFDGKSVNLIAREINKSPVSVNNLKVRAVEKFKKFVEEEKKKVKLDPVYNQCVFCNYEDVATLNEFIHLWLDEHDWNFNGILVQLKRVFKLENITQVQIVDHVKYHMGYTRDEVSKASGVVVPAKKKQKRKDTDLVITVGVSPTLKEKLDNLSYECSITRSELIRRSLEIGVQIEEKMIEINEIMTVEALKLAMFVRKLRD